MNVLIVGSGLAGVTVAEALAKSARHTVILVTDEIHGYYSRPRLSHGFALDGEAAAKIVLKRFDALAPGVRVLAGAEAWRIEREKRLLALSDGRSLDYDVLILAPGSAARIPPVLAPSRPHFLTLNNLDDLLTLRRRHAKSRAGGKTPHWAVIGGGLIGCELASDLHKAGDAVTIFHREPRLMELQLDEAQSRALHEHFLARGFELRYRQDVRGVFSGRVLTAEGEFGPYDGVIVSTGFAPRIELAKEAGLPTARGIVVDAYLRTADPRIYAAGDAAEIEGKLYAFVSPIRSQALWLAEHLEGRIETPWIAPAFKPVIKVHDFKPPSGSSADPAPGRSQSGHAAPAAVGALSGR
jgi:NAD(P)H-nitrite reductase large subunit